MLTMLKSRKQPKHLWLRMEKVIILKTLQITPKMRVHKFPSTKKPWYFLRKKTSNTSYTNHVIKG